MCLLFRNVAILPFELLTQSCLASVAKVAHPVCARGGSHRQLQKKEEGREFFDEINANDMQDYINACRDLISNHFNGDSLIF